VSIPANPSATATRQPAASAADCVASAAANNRESRSGAELAPCPNEIVPETDWGGTVPRRRAEQNLGLSAPIAFAGNRPKAFQPQELPVVPGPGSSAALSLGGIQVNDESRIQLISSAQAAEEWSADADQPTALVAEPLPPDPAYELPGILKLPFESSRANMADDLPRPKPLNGSAVPKPPQVAEVSPKGAATADRPTNSPATGPKSSGSGGEQPTGACAAGLCGACGCGGVVGGAAGEGTPPFKLIESPCLQAWRIDVGGWLQQGITFNAQEPGSRFNGPVATNDRHAEYQMNQLWAYAHRPTQTHGCGLDLGGRVDMVFGSDFRFGINHGLEDRINGLEQYYGLVIPQAYLEVAFNYLTVKLGHFAAILDYEAVPAPVNPFYSHSYCYGYTVPQLVTGLLASYQLSQGLSVDAGFHRGWMMFEDNNDSLDVMAGFRWTSPDKLTSVAYAFSVGPQDEAGRQDRFVYSLVVRRQLTDRLQYIVVHNLGWENDGVSWATPAPQDAEWYGINQYLLYQLNPRWSVGMRTEWLRDDDGARIAGVGNLVPGYGWPALPGFAGDFFEVTWGVNWRPHPNMLCRPEIRWDWYEGTSNLMGERPFDDGTSDYQVTIATDLIITF